MPTNLDNKVSFLLFSKIVPLGSSLPKYDANLYELIPLQYFELIHFSSYLSKAYHTYFRQIRASTKTNGGDKVKQLTVKEHDAIKTTRRKYNESMWTRQILNVSSVASSMGSEFEKDPNFKMREEQFIGPSLINPVSNSNSHLD